MDPISTKPIIVINEELIDFNIKYYLIVPIQVLNNTVLLKCIKIKNICINNKTIKDVMLGISESKIRIDGVDCLLNNKLRKELLND
jgi:predicted aspartyl protease